ncbi:acyl carrier protein [Armatimonadota bacterium]|nr:acyl carrier protein [Armatimonadota bacterium]GDX40588.1 acyl carrier protein [Armatimonadota bacterium]
MSTLDSVKKILVDKLPDASAEKITPEASVMDDLGADSLDVVEIIMAIEEEFSVDIPDEEAEALITVQSIVDYIEKSKK